MSITLLTLGLPSVTVDDVELASLQRHKLRCAVLVFVAVEREATRERIVGVFWPDRSPEAARHALSQTLYEIRQELGEDPFDVEGDRIRIAADVHVDAVEAESALAAGDAAAACALYRGPFLDGAYLWRTSEWEQWVDTQRAQRVRLHRKARRLLLGDAESAGRMQDALAAARAWVELDPLDDEAHHHFIELLARNGQRTAALQHYDEYARRLQRELEVDPLDETRDLVERIRAGRVQSAPPPRDDAPAPAIGESPAAGTDGELDPRLEVIRLIGRGSVATVYLARERPLRRLVAVKVLDAELAGDRTARLRFEREAEAAARIVHPNVVPVYWIGASRTGLPFMAMPYVKGGSLSERIEAWGTLEVRDALDVIAQVASGLAAAHRLGIIHRDVRAANVLFEQDSGRCLLCDFGLAAVLEELSASDLRLTRTGEWIGNPTCISPEQLLGQPVTPKTDVYGLGSLAFELIAGRGPFDATTPAELTLAHVRTQPHRLDELRADVSQPIVELIDRCLAKRPEHRPGVEEVLATVG